MSLFGSAGSGNYPETSPRGGTRADSDREASARFANSVIRGTWRPASEDDDED